MKKFSATLTLTLAPLLFTACATVAPPQPPTLELPKPPLDLRAVRKGNHVVLTWTVPSMTTDRQIIHAVGPTKICRGPRLDPTNCGTAVGESAAVAAPKSSDAPKKKVEASYSDTLPTLLESDAPSDVTFYAVQVLNSEGRAAGISNRVPVQLVRTLPPPREFSAQVTNEGVVLSWSGEAAPASSGSRYVYRIYRRAETQQRRLVGEIPASQSRMTLADPEIEWQKNYAYTIETDTLIDRAGRLPQVIEGEDSPAITVFADDKFPPAVPAALQAVFSGPGQKAFIDLVWAPDSDADLAGYNIYRHTQGSPPVKINSDPAQAPAYRDAAVEAGKRYFYSVSAIDVRGNESGRSEEASESVP